MTTCEPLTPGVWTLVWPFVIVASSFLTVLKATFSVAVVVRSSTRWTATASPSVTAVSAAGTTRSLAPSVTPSALSSSATVAAEVASARVAPSTVIVTWRGLVTVKEIPSRPRPAERETDSVAPDSARMPSSFIAWSTVVAVVQ